MSSVYIETNKKILIQSGGAWRASRLQRSNVASARGQDEVIAAGGWWNGVTSGILGGFLRLFRRAGLLEVHAIQRFVTIPSIEKRIGLGTLSNGTGALAELGFVQACQSAFTKILQLVQVDAWIPGEHELQSLFSAGPSRGLLPDIEPVGRERDPLEERLDLVRYCSSRPQGFEDGNNGLVEILAQLGDRMESAFGQCYQFP
jgi:hypothetical protein